MSDTYHRYTAIQRSLMHFYQPRPTGHHERHLNTRVALICGLAGGQHAHLAAIADHAPSNGADQERLITRFRRWLKHDTHTIDGWFLPIAAALLANLAHPPLVLVLDGSSVGRGCVALMLSVVYHGRALPLAWVVVHGTKGHFPQQTHCALLAQVQNLIPASVDVTVLGDGAFDGPEFQAARRTLKWQYVCRTTPKLLMTVEGSNSPSARWRRSVVRNWPSNQPGSRRSSMVQSASWPCGRMRMRSRCTWSRTCRTRRRP